MDSFSDFGEGYTCPPGVKYGNESAKTLLVGSFDFVVEEYEVYAV